MCAPPHEPTVERIITFERAEMARRGRIGGLATGKRHDGLNITQAARTAFLAGFERDVDPNGELPESKRRELATAAKRAHFQRLARLSADARARRSQPPVSPSETDE